MKLTTDSQERKDTPIFSGFMKYFPLAIAEVARLSKAGNDKHNPGQPLHWSREKSSDHGDCIVRHQIDAGTIDEEDGFLHDVKVAWRAMAQLEVALELDELKKDVPPSIDKLFEVKTLRKTEWTRHDSHVTDFKAYQVVPSANGLGKVFRNDIGQLCNAARYKWEDLPDNNSDVVAGKGVFYTELTED